MPDSTTRTPLRYIRLEYYTMDPSKKESPKMKGLNHACEFTYPFKCWSKKIVLNLIV